MLELDIEDAVMKVVYSKGKELEIEIVEANGALDHFHVLVQSKPNLSPSDIAKHLKGSSSHFVNRVTLKNDEIRQLYWQDGYGVVSVSPQAMKSVQEYVRRQKEHHSKGTVKKEWEISGID
jgi:REP element-mobilizing transposase RayT